MWSESRARESWLDGVARGARQRQLTRGAENCDVFSLDCLISRDLDSLKEEIGSDKTARERHS